MVKNYVKNKTIMFALDYLDDPISDLKQDSLSYSIGHKIILDDLLLAKMIK